MYCGDQIDEDRLGVGRMMDVEVVQAELGNSVDRVEMNTLRETRGLAGKIQPVIR